ncbi:MAG: Coenzyme F420 hydrogenase/dehydrogenase, beta subunit C-terminal domain [Desulfovibrionaceae bacterium]
MKRPRAEAPKRTDARAGRYDGAYLLGPYERLLLARSKNPATQRAAASGGVLTETLSALLERGEVEAVLSVGFAGGDPLTPRYLPSFTPRELRERCGSVYAYVSPSELKHAAGKLAGRPVAVVCQPCLVPLVRRWQASGPGEKRPDVRFVASFFCGYNMTIDATYHLLGKAGVRPEDAAWVRYRHGAYPGGFAVGAKDGREVRFGKESYELVNLQFVRRGCSRCGLYMGEGADLSCGDAWLKGQRNLTAVLARTPLGLEKLAQVADRLELFELPERTLVDMHLHNLVYKKYGNPLPLRLLNAFFRDVLPKGWAPFRLLSAASRKRREKKIGVGLKLVPMDKDQLIPASPEGGPDV